MNLMKKYLRCGADDLMSYYDYRAMIQGINRRLSRSAIIRALPLVACILFVSCQSLPPSTIGSDTREKLSELHDQIATVATQAETIDAGVKTVAADISTLENKAPAELKPEIEQIKTKLAVLSGLTGKQVTDSKVAVKTESDVSKSFGNAMDNVAKLEQDRAKAVIDAEKAKGHRNILFAILSSLIVILCAFFLLKYKFFRKTT